MNENATGRGISRGAIYSAGEKTMELSDCGRVQSGVNPIWPYPWGSNCIILYDIFYHIVSYFIQLSIQAVLVSHLAVSDWSVWGVLIVIINRGCYKFSEHVFITCCNLLSAFSWYSVHWKHHSSITPDMQQHLQTVGGCIAKADCRGKTLLWRRVLA